MTARDMAAVAFKAMSAWLIVSGVAGMVSVALTWAQDVAMYGKEAAAWRLAASAIYVPVGAIAWLVSDWASRLGFPAGAEPEALGVTRADLYAFASVLVGLYLLADALPQAGLVRLRRELSGDLAEPEADTSDSAGVRRDGV